MQFGGLHEATIVLVPAFEAVTVFVLAVEVAPTDATDDAEVL